MADGPLVGGVKERTTSRRPGSSCETRAVSVSSTRALAGSHREPLGDAAAGSENVLLLGVLGADDELWRVGGDAEQRLNVGRRRD